MQELVGIFFNVISPVFLVVLIGYVAGPRLDLQARTLSRSAYYVFIPAFVFLTLGSAQIDAALLTKMVIFSFAVTLLAGLLGGVVARLMGLSSTMTRAFIILATFANVGNFGLPIIQFRLGEEALAPATIYFLAILVVSFVVCVAAASWGSGGASQAMLSVIKTPALVAIVPALFVNGLNLELPLMVARVCGLLSGAMIPVMLLGLGVQLAGIEQIKVDGKTVAISGVRLLIAPILAIGLALVLGIEGIERGAGIFQSAMPPAVLCSIIALEYDVEPDFVTTTVLFATIMSVITLTLLLAVV